MADMPFFESSVSESSDYDEYMFPWKRFIVFSFLACFSQRRQINVNNSLRWLSNITKKKKVHLG